MTYIDIAFGFLAGVVSCLTPQALLLLPLAFVAAGAVSRTNVIAPAFGLGFALALTGIVAGSLGALFGFEAIWFRRIVCGLLMLLGIALMSPSLVERFPRLTGGHDRVFGAGGGASAGGAVRRLLLTLLVGANWFPLPGPTLGKASMMAADTRNSGVALGVLFIFGVGAALPWIVLGRIFRLVSRPFAAGVLQGMAGNRILGFTLLLVALLGATASGRETIAEHWLGPKLPHWTQKMAITF